MGSSATHAHPLTMFVSSAKKFVPVVQRKRYRSALDGAMLQWKTATAKLQRSLFKPGNAKLAGPEINLHLGCGPIDHPRFVNIDGLPMEHVDFIRPLDDLSNFKDESVHLVYACHCLEHFSHNQTIQVLTEWHRVLRKDGILRLSVPDFDLMLDVYKDNDCNISSIHGPLMGGQDYKFNFHYTVFNRSHLTQVLQKVGFHSIEEWYPGSDELTSLDDWSGRNIEFGGKSYSVSLNLQACK